MKSSWIENNPLKTSVICSFIICLFGMMVVTITNTTTHSYYPVNWEQYFSLIVPIIFLSVSGFGFVIQKINDKSNE